MIEKIVLTGAGGRLGSYLRDPISKLCKNLVSTDIKKNIGPLYENEKFIQADLSNFDEINPIIENASMVCHFGAIVDELPFDKLLGPNYIGSYNIWESSRRHKVKRVIYSSSMHAVGMYPKTMTLKTDTPHRPDSFYGLAKCFTEDLAKMYFEKNKIEAVCLRIASCAPVNNARSLSSWLSYNDLIKLVIKSIDTPYTGYTVIYGISNNDRKNVDNSNASHIGYIPEDNAEIFAAEILQKDLTEELNDKGNQCHGGAFASTELGVSPMKKMNIIHDPKIKK
jgi:uronate dehydrogenase